MAESTTLAMPPTVAYGSEWLTREDTIARLTLGMLGRLPQSLWDQDPATVQGQLYAAVAAELATWLEAWAVTRQCTLLQYADGVDLDTLLADYGIKRYNQRPDALARQIARQILFSPKETLFSLQDLGQLLTDYPQLIARSGRYQPHYWIGATHPVTVDRTYWQLADRNGVVWYLLIAHGEILLSRSPAPGANVTPLADGASGALPGSPPWQTWGDARAYAAGRGDVATLTWFTVPDAGGDTWYVTIDIHGTCALSQDLPPPGPGTSARLELLDGAGQAWRLLAEPETQSLIPFALSAEAAPASYWRLVDADGVVWFLVVDDRVPALYPYAPLWLDTTPGGDPLAWCVVETGTGQSRYLTVTTLGELALVADAPPGPGTTQPPLLVDAAHQLWTLTLEDNWQAVRLDAIPPEVGTTFISIVDPRAILQLLVLLDPQDDPWSLWIAAGEVTLFDNVPTDIANVTPPGGPFHWWRRTDLDGTRYAVTPDGEGELLVQTITPNGLGTVPPDTLGDADHALWHAGCGRDGSLGIADTPPLVWSDAETCLILNDPVGVRWFWCLNEDTQELVCSATQEPDAIPWMAVGEVGALEAQTPYGVTGYMLPETSGEALVSHGLQLDHPWSIPAQDAPMRDGHRRVWLLRLADDGSLQPEVQPAEDLPQVAPLIYVRDLYEAFTHIHAGGSLSTFWVA